MQLLLSRVFIAGLFCLSAPAFSGVETMPEITAKTAPVLSLSAPLRALLSEEMHAIQEGMMAIVPAYSEGNTTEIANIAKQIKASYILKRKLTEQQRQELQSKLPQSFLQLDKQFHYNAGMLENAAREKKHELIGFYFSQLSEACAGCHSQFALHQFPHLRSPQEAVKLKP